MIDTLPPSKTKVKPLQHSWGPAVHHSTWPRSARHSLAKRSRPAACICEHDTQTSMANKETGWILLVNRKSSDPKAVLSLESRLAISLFSIVKNDAFLYNIK